MALQFNQGVGTDKTWVSDRRLYLSPDRNTVCEQEAVDQGCHPKHSLLAAIGHKVSGAETEKYGLGPLAIATDAPADTPDVWDAEPTTDTGGAESGPQNGSQDEEAPEVEADAERPLPPPKPDPRIAPGTDASKPSRKR